MNAPAKDRAVEYHPLSEDWDWKGNPKERLRVEAFEAGRMRLEVVRIAAKHVGDPEKVTINVPVDLHSRATKALIESIGGGGRYTWKILPEVGAKIVDQGAWVAGGDPVPVDRLGMVTAAVYWAEQTTGGGPVATVLSAGDGATVVLPKNATAEQVERLTREARTDARDAKLAYANVATGAGALGAVMPLLTGLVNGRSDPANFAALEQVRQVLATSDEQVRGAGRREDELLAQLRAANAHADSRVMRAEDAAREREVHLRDMLREALSDDRAEISTRAQFWKTVAQDANDRTKKIEGEKDEKIRRLEEDLRKATTENIQLALDQRSGEVVTQILKGVNDNPLLQRYAATIGTPAGSNGSSAPQLPSGMEGFTEYLSIIQKHPSAWVSAVRALTPYIERIAAHPSGPDHYTSLFGFLVENIAEFHEARDEAERRERAASASPSP